MTSGEFTSWPLAHIVVDRENRQRKNLTNIEELAVSIGNIGLINPIVIQRDGLLVAGERRFEAMKSLGWTNAPVQFVDELSKLELHLIELEENIKRTGLTWQEECLAIEEYHRLKKEQEGDQWTWEDTADGMGISKATMGQKIQVAKEIRAGNEKVAEAPRYSIARNIVDRKVQREKSSAIRSILEDDEDEISNDVAAPKPTHPLINGDFVEWQKTYAGDKFNFIHCDFPYGIGAGDFDQGSGADFGGYEDSPEIYWALIAALKAAMDNVIDESAHLLFWFSAKYYEDTKAALADMGWTVFPYPLIWLKSDNIGILSDPKRSPRVITETAFFASRGDRNIVRAVSNAVAHPGRNKSIHMSEKPVEMLSHFFRMVVDEYSTVLDPTCGSGNAVKTALGLGAHKAIGIEKSKEFYDEAVSRFIE